jgi:hypothetical protein
LDIVSIDGGMQITSSDEQYANAHSPRIETLQPDSKTKLELVLQPQKQAREIVSIDEGI